MPHNLVCGSAIDILASLSPLSFDCCITSPPYFKQREYTDDERLVKAEIGREDDPDAYLTALVRVFDEVKRVLRDDGLLIVNIGDKVAERAERSRVSERDYRLQLASGTPLCIGPSQTQPTSYFGMPERFVLTMMQRNWVYADCLIWWKPNVMPSGAATRFTRDFEHIFIFAKKPAHHWFADTLVQPSITQDIPDVEVTTMRRAFWNDECGGLWPVSTQGHKFRHFAAFPEKLICDLLSLATPSNYCAICDAPFKPHVDVQRFDTRPGEANKFSEEEEKKAPKKVGNRCRARTVSRREVKGWAPSCSCPGVDSTRLSRTARVLDPFGGSGTVSVCAKQMGRASMCIDLNPESIKIAEERLSAVR
jgi:DNA modification methylase